VYRADVNSAARTLSYAFTVSHLRLDGRHITNGRMIGIPVVSGNGPMWANVNNGRFEGVLTWQLRMDGTLEVVEQTTHVDAQVTVRMEGFGLMTNTVNNQINAMIPEMLNDPAYQQQLNDIIDGILFPILNGFINYYQPNELADRLENLAINPSAPAC
jgi:uncharacterized protein Usg